MIEIKLDKKDLNLIIRRSNQILTEANNFISGRTSPLKAAAEMYAAEVKSAIIQETFDASYTALNPAYKAWKNFAMKYAVVKKNPGKGNTLKAMGLSGTFNKFWQLTGSVISNIKVWKGPSGRGMSTFLSGLEKNSSSPRFSRKGNSLLRKTKGTWYAVILEEGRGNVPARPLFGPVWERFCKGGAISGIRYAFRNMKSVWRP